MGSYVRPEELASAGSEREPERASPESSSSSEAAEQGPEPLGTYLSGHLAGVDVDAVEEVRRLRHRERE